jgi:hypothetical protein
MTATSSCAVFVAEAAGGRALRAELAELREVNAELYRAHGLLEERVSIQQMLIDTQRAQLRALTEVPAPHNPRSRAAGGCFAGCAPAAAPARRAVSRSSRFSPSNSPRTSAATGPPGARWLRPAGGAIFRSVLQAPAGTPRWRENGRRRRPTGAQPDALPRPRPHAPGARWRLSAGGATFRLGQVPMVLLRPHSAADIPGRSTRARRRTP